MMFSVPKGVVLILANSSGPGEMQHLGLNCLPEYPFRDLWISSIQWDKTLIGLHFRP